jgi:hypothetical protein
MDFTYVSVYIWASGFNEYISQAKQNEKKARSQEMFIKIRFYRQRQFLFKNF